MPRMCVTPRQHREIFAWSVVPGGTEELPYSPWSYPRVTSLTCAQHYRITHPSLHFKTQGWHCKALSPAQLLQPRRVIAQRRYLAVKQLSFALFCTYCRLSIVRGTCTAQLTASSHPCTRCKQRQATTRRGRHQHC